MYYEKAEIVRNEIGEDVGEGKTNDHSIFVLFCIFIGYFFKNVFELVKFLIKGLWCFIEYGYYRFMAWEDDVEKSRDEYFNQRRES